MVLELLPNWLLVIALATPQGRHGASEPRPATAAPDGCGDQGRGMCSLDAPRPTPPAAPSSLALPARHHRPETGAKPLRYAGFTLETRSLACSGETRRRAIPTVIADNELTGFDTSLIRDVGTLAGHELGIGVRNASRAAGEEIHARTVTAFPFGGVVFVELRH